MTFTIIFPLGVWAMPGSFEIWFISPDRTANIKLPQEIKFYQSIAQNNLNLTCQKYGEYCFDPQVGLYKEDEKLGYIEVGDEAQNIEKEVDKKNLKAETDKNRTKSYIDSSVVDCRKGSYFDIFCGKERKNRRVKDVSLEVWIDTSSSLKNIDPTDKTGGCRRRSLAVSLKTMCGNEVDLYAYHTQKSYQSNVDNFCNSYGLNDENRLMRWITESNAKHLVVITDIGEYTSKISDFVRANSGYIRGTEVEDIVSPEKMKELVGSVAKFCKKK